jgi:hypothetical protein
MGRPDAAVREPVSELDPALTSALEVVASRLEQRGLELSGRIQLRDLDRPARHALGGLLGRPIVQDRLTLDLAELDEIARDRLSLPGGIVEACEQLLGRALVDRRAHRQARHEDRQSVLRPLRELDQSWAQTWADEVGRAGLLTRSSDPAATAAQAVAVLLEIFPVHLLQASSDTENHDVSSSYAAGGSAASTVGARTELAARVCGSAHALDDGTILAACVLRALAHAVELPVPVTPSDRRELWSRFGVAPDRVSTTVLTLGLRSRRTDRVARWLAEAAELRAAVHLTARDVEEVDPHAGVEPVLVCENPRVLEAALEHGVPGEVVCAMGRPNTLVLALLVRLREAGRTLRYHGDFDWPGISITTQLQSVGATPWRMGATDYLEAVARNPGGVPLTGRPAPTPWDSMLSTAMQEAGIAVHEELLLPELLHRWS